MALLWMDGFDHYPFTNLAPHTGHAPVSNNDRGDLYHFLRQHASLGLHSEVGAAGFYLSEGRNGGRALSLVNTGYSTNISTNYAIYTQVAWQGDRLVMGCAIKPLRIVRANVDSTTFSATNFRYTNTSDPVTGGVVGGHTLAGNTWDRTLMSLESLRSLPANNTNYRSERLFEVRSNTSFSNGGEGEADFGNELGVGIRTCYFRRYNYLTDETDPSYEANHREAFAPINENGYGEHDVYMASREPLIAGVWNYVDVEVDLSVDTGPCVRLWVNNKMGAECRLPEILSKAEIQRLFQRCVLGHNRSNLNYDFHAAYDDWYILDGTGDFNNRRLGNIRIATRRPSEDVTTQFQLPAGMPGPHHALVNDSLGIDGDASYVSGTMSGQYDLYANPTPIDNYPMQAVMAIVSARRTGGDSRDVRPILALGNNVVQGGTLPYQALDYSLGMHIFERNPFSNAAWGKYEIEALSFGYKLEEDQFLVENEQDLTNLILRITEDGSMRVAEDGEWRAS